LAREEVFTNSPDSLLQSVDLLRYLAMIQHVRNGAGEYLRMKQCFHTAFLQSL